MIDLHSHILPGIDDGASDIDQSLDMARLAVEDGIELVVATPHSHTDIYHPSPEHIHTLLHLLKNELNQKQIPLKVVSGAEVRIHAKMDANKAATQQASINRMGRYLLVEFPHNMMLPGTKDVLFQLVIKGVRPILAHPERNTALQHNPEILFNLVEMGCLVQLTAMSITGELGLNAMKLSHFLLRHRLAHIIATDSHNADRRPPVLTKAVAAASDILDDAVGVRKMVADIPLAIIAGKSVNPPAPRPIRSQRKKSWKERLFGWPNANI